MFLFDIYYDKRFGKIVASALKHNNKLYIGKNHAECFIQEPKGVLRGAEQGFITENNIFVGRKKALKIARHYNQIKHKHFPQNELFSEDLL